MRNSKQKQRLFSASEGGERDSCSVRRFWLCLQVIFVGRDFTWPQTAHEANASLAELHRLGVEVITARLCNSSGQPRSFSFYAAGSGSFSSAYGFILSSKQSSSVGLQGVWSVEERKRLVQHARSRGVRHVFMLLWCADTRIQQPPPPSN